MKISIALTLTLIAQISSADQSPQSICYGTPEKGRLENGRQLPSSGKNFSAYSRIGITLRRNYVHSKVYAAVMDAYEELETKAPGKVFVYGETGWPEGGRFKPHKTHQNGLSVDFLVPVVNAEGTSVPLPASVFNKFGYEIEFRNDGKYKDYTIDFKVMSEHLLALNRAAEHHGIKIKRVIFDNELQKMLFTTSHGEELHKSMTFSKKKPWIRHDEHYHVDFDVKCK